MLPTLATQLIWEDLTICLMSRWSRFSTARLAAVVFRVRSQRFLILLDSSTCTDWQKTTVWSVRPEHTLHLLMNFSTGLSAGMGSIYRFLWRYLEPLTLPGEAPCLTHCGNNMLRQSCRYQISSRPPRSCTSDFRDPAGSKLGVLGLWVARSWNVRRRGGMHFKKFQT